MSSIFSQGGRGIRNTQFAASGTIQGEQAYSIIDLYSLSDYINRVKKAYSLTEAKARLSEIVDRLIHEKEIVVITKKGENVAVLIPYGQFVEIASKNDSWLIRAREALAPYEDELDEMMRIIAAARKEPEDREVKL
jgi:prevent-host-death family protein